MGLRLRCEKAALHGCLQFSYFLRPGDVLYGRPRKRVPELFYRTTGLLITDGILTDQARIRRRDRVMDAVNSGSRRGVRIKPLHVFVRQYWPLWHAWMSDLTPEQRISLVRVALSWDNKAAWNAVLYKNPRRNYFNCVGFVEYCFEQIGMDICPDHIWLIPNKQLRAFRRDRYAYQRRKRRQIRS